MTLLIVYILIALGFSFLCSILEATLLTLSPTVIETSKRKGAKWAPTMEKLKKDIERPLSAILTLNTIAHTMGASGAGSQFQKMFGNVWLTAFSVILTLAILVFTEIIPKTIGARYSVALAGPTAWILPKLQWILSPLVWFCRQITRLLTFGKANAEPMHREELLAVTRMGEAEGVLNASEGQVVRNVLRLGEIPVSDIMTPRPVMFTMPGTISLCEFAEASAAQPFSRIPVYDGDDVDKIDYFILRADALAGCLKNQDDPLEAFKRPLPTIPRELSVEILFQQLIAGGHHMMSVHDEFGTTVGLVTLEDVLETIVGVEIVDEQDAVTDMQELARQRWSDRTEEEGNSESP